MIKGQKINPPAVYVLIVLPLLLIIAAIFYVKKYSFGWFEFGLLIGTYYACNIAVGVGLHRLWSHSAYKVNKFVEFILLLLSSATLQGPIIAWVSTHFKHHAYADKPGKDPHTPLEYDGGIKGFLWSHFVWMITGEASYTKIADATMARLGKNKMIMWEFKNYIYIATFMNTVAPVLIAMLFGGFTLKSVFAGLIFMGLGRALQQEVTFCVNSVCHTLGAQKYCTDTSRDVWWLAPFLLGENWHNYHHAFPSDYRNGIKWYHLDIHKWIIYSLKMLGLAWDLKTTTQVRIDAKVQRTLKITNERRKELSLIKEDLFSLSENITAKLNAVDVSMIHQSMSYKLNEVKRNVMKLRRKIYRKLNKNFDIISDSFVDSVNSRFVTLERSVTDLIDKLNKSDDTNSNLVS